MKIYQIYDGQDPDQLYRAETVEDAMLMWCTEHDGHLPWEISEVPQNGPAGLVDVVEVWSDKPNTEEKARAYAHIAGIPVEAALVEYRARNKSLSTGSSGKIDDLAKPPGGL